MEVAPESSCTGLDVASVPIVSSSQFVWPTYWRVHYLQVTKYIMQLEEQVYFLLILYSLWVFVLLNVWTGPSSIILQQTHLSGRCCLQLPPAWSSWSPWAPFKCLALTAMLATLAGWFLTTGMSGMIFLMVGSLCKIGRSSSNHFLKGGFPGLMVITRQFFILFLFFSDFLVFFFLYIKSFLSSFFALWRIQMWILLVLGRFRWICL